MWVLDKTMVSYLAVSTIILSMKPTKKTTATEAKMRPKRLLLFFCSAVVAMMLQSPVRQ